MKFIIITLQNVKHGLLIALFSVTSFIACGQMKYEEKLESIYKKTVPLIKPNELVHNENTIILDTRAIHEYETSHIEGAKFVDYDSFTPAAVSEIDKNKKVIVYCSVGYRSERIGEKLQEMGFKDVHNLYGGIFQWVNEGKPVVNMKKEATDSVHTYNKKWGRWLKKGVKVYE